MIRICVLIIACFALLNPPIFAAEMGASNEKVNATKTVKPAPSGGPAVNKGEQRKEDSLYPSNPEALIAVLFFFGLFAIVYLFIRRQPTTKDIKKKKKRKKL